jgi:hypothetical protein
MSKAAAAFDFDQDGQLNRNAGGNDLQHHRVAGPERTESLVAKCAQGVVDVLGDRHQAKPLIKDAPACEPHLHKASEYSARRSLVQAGHPGTYAYLTVNLLLPAHRPRVSSDMFW